MAVKDQIKEIPRNQRYVDRPSLEKIFEISKDKSERNSKIRKAHINYGYTLKEIADFLNIHYATASRAMKAGS